MAAYTAQLGNGVSASFSVEEPRRLDVVNTSFAAASASPYVVGALPTPEIGKIMWPDLVANLRVDQAWGSAQLMGAVHQVAGGYYGATLTGAIPNGHPDDKVGFAVGAGVKINFPMIGPGDYFQGQVNYTEGASRYAALTQPGSASPGVFGAGQQLGVGYVTDSTYCGLSSGSAATATCPAGGSSQQLTTAWGVDAAYEHFWTPALRTSLVGAYNAYSFNSAASSMMCTAFGAGAVAGAATATGATTFGRQLRQRVRSTGATTASLPVPSGTSPRTSTSVWKATMAI